MTGLRSAYRTNVRSRLPWIAMLMAALAANPTAFAAAPDTGPALLGTRTIAADAPFVDATIAGQPVRLRLDFGGHGAITLKPEATTRLALAGDVRPNTKKKPSRGVIRSSVGRQTTRVPFSTEQVLIDGITRPLVVVTPNGYTAEGADGTILPSALPYRVVRLVQRSPRPTDVETAFPISDNGRFDGLPFRARAGDADIQISLAPDRARTLATAAAGGALAVGHGGKLTGPILEQEVAYGVARPTRLVRLDRPWTASGVPVSSFMMRIHDWEGRAPIPPDADLSEADIEVSARHNAQRGIRLMRLGADALGNCATIEWRRIENQLAIRCPALAP